MDRLTFYKSIFDKEQNRRNELNNSVNQPITLVTLLVGLLYFLYNNNNLTSNCFIDLIILIALCAAFVLFLICIYYLALSFNNFLIGFSYKDFPKTLELFDYDKKIEIFNATAEEDQKQDFEKYLIQKYVEYSDNYVNVNDKRLLNLYKAKKFLIIILSIEIFIVILYILKHLLTK